MAKESTSDVIAASSSPILTLQMTLCWLLKPLKILKSFFTHSKSQQFKSVFIAIGQNGIHLSSSGHLPLTLLKGVNIKLVNNFK